MALFGGPVHSLSVCRIASLPQIPNLSIQLTSSNVKMILLLQLPKEAQINTLKIMSFVRRLNLSLLSKKCKSLVKSLNVTGPNLTANIGDIFQMVIQLGPASFVSCLFVQNQDGEDPAILGRPERIVVYEDGIGIREWFESQNTAGLTVKDFSDHLVEVFHMQKFMLHFGRNANRFNLQSVCETLSNFMFLVITNGNHQHNREIVNLFKPENIIIRDNAFSNNRILHHTLIQNFRSLLVTSPTGPILLDDLQLLNSSKIEFSDVNVSGNTLNRFLKLWIKGANTRIEKLVLTISESRPFFEQEVLKDIQLHDVQGVRYFESTGDEAELIEGGKDILGLDGVTATVFVVNTVNSATFEMFVWHDHCIATEEDI